jgi:uncharacterized membrane protein
LVRALSADGETRGKLASRLALAALLTCTGTLHFMYPRAYDRMIPEMLGAPRVWTLASGAAEVASAALLAVPRTKRLGAWAIAALLVAVFPSNIDAALSGGMPARGWLGSAQVAWLRLPLQLPLIWWALSHRRGGGRLARPDS